MGGRELDQYDGAGGLRGQHEKALEQAFITHLKAAYAAADRIAEPKRRAAAITRLKRAAKELKDSIGPAPAGADEGTLWDDVTSRDEGTAGDF